MSIIIFFTDFYLFCVLHKYFSLIAFIYFSAASKNLCCVFNESSQQQHVALECNPFVPITLV